MATISKKELAITIKKANKAYFLDLAVSYQGDKPRIYRKSNPQYPISPPNLTLQKTFYWLDAWLDGYAAARTTNSKPHWMAEKEIPALERP